MPQVAGVITETNTKGEIVRVTIDVEKHREMITPVLVQMGVLEKTELQKILESGNWLSIEESRQSTLKHIRERWSK